jgi:hypothetical protein
VGGDAGQHRGEDDAARDIDDVMSAALGEEPEAGARGCDQLRARPVRGGLDGLDDRVGVDKLQRGVARHGLDDARPLQRKLLGVRQIDDGAPAAPRSVLAKGHGSEVT